MPATPAGEAFSFRYRACTDQKEYRLSDHQQNSFCSLLVFEPICPQICIPVRRSLFWGFRDLGGVAFWAFGVSLFRNFLLLRQSKLLKRRSPDPRSVDSSLSSGDTLIPCTHDSFAMSKPLRVTVEKFWPSLLISGILRNVLHRMKQFFCDGLQLSEEVEEQLNIQKHSYLKSPDTTSTDSMQRKRKHLPRPGRANTTHDSRTAL